MRSCDITLYIEGHIFLCRRIASCYKRVSDLDDGGQGPVPRWEARYLFIFIIKMLAGVILVIWRRASFEGSDETWESILTVIDWMPAIIVTAATSTTIIREVTLIFAERYLSERFKAGVEQGRQKGRQEGRQEGIHLGRQEGRVEGREEVLEWLAQVEEAKLQGAEPPAPPWEYLQNSVEHE